MKIELTKQDKHNIKIISYLILLGVFILIGATLYFSSINFFLNPNMMTLIQENELAMEMGAYLVLAFVIFLAIILWFTIRIAFELYYLASQNNDKVKR